MIERVFTANPSKRAVDPSHSQQEEEEKVSPDPNAGGIEFIDYNTNQISTAASGFFGADENDESQIEELMMQQVKQEQADLDEDRDDNEDDEDDEDEEDPIATLTISSATKRDGTFGDNGFGLTDVSV